jgi:hypothetical protein
MALHRKREEASPAAARLLLVSTVPVELPPAELDEQCATVERAEFAQHLPELYAALRIGGTVNPVPIVQSDSLFIVNGVTRSFWVRLWHADETRTCIARLHVLNCVPLVPNVKVDLPGFS